MFYVCVKAVRTTKEALLGLGTKKSIFGNNFQTIGKLDINDLQYHKKGVYSINILQN